MLQGSRWKAARARLAALFQDHEIFVRTGGEVRFLRVSAGWQKRIAAIAGVVLLAWAVVTVGFLVNQASTVRERAALAARQAAAAKSEARVAKYRNRVEDVAADLDERQAYLEGLVSEHFGVDRDAAAAPAAKADKPEPARVTSAADPAVAAANGVPPELAHLRAIESRQEAFAARMLATVEARAEKAEAAIARLGFNPGAIVRNASARGGPFEPFRGRMGKGAALGPAFRSLESALFRMEVLERTLVAIPSGNPASVMMMSSGFGYRSDPFTGAGAMHAGLDFRGPIGTPILAASAGRVSFVGVRSGYGNVVEIDHGQGILTRYAHLSGFDTRVGATVSGGGKIARMGSTGRSTGSHLHFEVRLNGVAVNPRRFLEANKDVLEVTANARQRVGAISSDAS